MLLAMMMSELSGFINIDKPVDWTSHDVVAKLRRVLGMKRIGHTGTLDPFATGVLPIAIGSATRLIRFLNKSKRYLAEIDLRNTTDTDDLTGEALVSRSVTIDEKEFRNKLLALKGTYEQIPPLYSAKKINGKKLYELMRAGEPVDLSDVKAKTITISEINLLDFNYPFAKFEVACSEGTYIRSIARDLGGHLSSLRRTESNGFDIKSAIRFEDLEDTELNPEELILKAADYLDLPAVEFEHKDVISLQQGRRVPINLLEQEGDKYLKCLNSDKNLVGLASILTEQGNLLTAQPLVIL